LQQRAIAAVAASPQSRENTAVDSSALGAAIDPARKAMNKRRTTPATIDQYIAASPAAARPILKEIRKVIRSAAPEAEELISYRMPAFRQHGILVYFAAFKNHVGLYPPVSGDARLGKSLAPYAGPKGNLKFPLDRPIPYALIRRIVKLKLKQNVARTSARSGAQPRSGMRLPDKPKR
jgi:uncharacterized protein YdhG (YjbR/CyaY superfamily)